MKPGANFQDRNDIKRWVEEGKDVGFISDALQIEPKVVANFVKAFKADMNREEPNADLDDLDQDDSDQDDSDQDDLDQDDLDQDEDEDEDEQLD